ncbi:hypothetical protein B0J17DRAFT_671434 [Rhizoctonia solani]|nr:hypothetical protein B0J17DRAFT_671434 [Rhizoctonia solani]
MFQHQGAKLLIQTSRWYTLEDNLNRLFRYSCSLDCSGIDPGSVLDALPIAEGTYRVSRESGSITLA